MEHARLAGRIKERGREIGFAAVGVADAGPSRHADFLRRWLAAGRAGRMAWIERSAGARADPKNIAPWARSAIVAAAAYLPYRGRRDGQEGLVRHVARYAVGSDYHRVLRDRLGRLAAFVRDAAPGARTLASVDTGPLLERELAARAGIGWFGKSTNLIGADGDSWMLLGVLLTDLDLPPDDPVADRCGTCTACLDACPTGAILEPYLVDSRRCISYLTIELRGRIPEQDRSGIGDWVFGCDVCQEVCPWNRAAAPAGDPAFAPGEPLRRRRLADLVRLTAAEYRREFRKTALGRPLRWGAVRNALIAAARAEIAAAVERGGAGGRRRSELPELGQAAVPVDAVAEEC
jgi:epoxyqueuosine reductase